jgi:hypothetical protein
MDSRIEDLLKKYWACETTLEEEDELRAWFARNEAPEAWRETADLFRYFDDQRKLTTEDPVVMNQLTSSPPAGKWRSLVQMSLKIAAGLAVVITSVYVVREELRKEEDPLALEDTYDDPKEAFEETKKALLMISKGFGRAEQQTKKINLFNEAQDKIKSEAEQKETQQL